MVRFAPRLYRLILFSVTIVLFSCAGSEEKKTAAQTFGQVDGEEVIPVKYKAVYIDSQWNAKKEEPLRTLMLDRVRFVLSRNAHLKAVATPESADMEMLIVAKSFTSAPIEFDALGKPVSELLQLTLDISATSRTESDKSLPEAREVVCRTKFVSRKAPYETEYTALERLSEQCSDRIVFIFLHGWYSELKTVKELGYDPERGAKEKFLEQVIPKDLPVEKREELLKLYEKYLLEIEENKPPEERGDY